MANALTDPQLQLLRLAEMGDAPLARAERALSYFADVELLLLLGFMEPRREGFMLTEQGSTILAHLRATVGAASGR